LALLDCLAGAWPQLTKSSRRKQSETRERSIFTCTRIVG
jgi:hypothetical protein